jgi:hypothetical protein
MRLVAAFHHFLEDPGAAGSALIASIGAALAAGATDPHS